MYEKNNEVLQAAFRKPQRFNPIDRIMTLRSPTYIHVEIVFPSYLGGVSFSSRGRGRPKGVGFKDIKYSHPERWDFVSIPMSKTGIRILFNKCKEDAEKKLKYDWLGATFTVVLDIPVDSKNRWWCSEICAYRLGIKDYKIIPIELFDALECRICQHTSNPHKYKKGIYNAKNNNCADKEGEGCMCRVTQ